MKRLIISCEKCNYHIQEPEFSPYTQRLKKFPLWPFVPDSLICVKCGEAAIVRIVEKGEENANSTNTNKVKT